MKTEKVTCDVVGCGEDAYYVADACWGWKVTEGTAMNPIKFKKMEKPLKPTKSDLCMEHWIEWSKATIKVMKMHKEKKK